MKCRPMWLVGFLLLSLAGCTENEPAIDEQVEPSVVDEAAIGAAFEEAGQVAVEEATAAERGQQDCSERLGLPVEIVNDLGRKLRLMPTGEFLMGSERSAEESLAMFGLSDDENWLFLSELPQHHVRITKPFYLGVHEVTVSDFRQFIEATSYEPEGGGWGWNDAKGEIEEDAKYDWQNVGFAQADDHPVVNVSWNDAVAFCQWLSKLTGDAYRLPTEAEWEYACRAGTTTQYCFGDDPAGLGVRAWFKGNSGRSTHPVGQKSANAWGLCDMHGNVAEWCGDWKESDYYSSSPEEDPPGPPEGASSMFRVTRGGAWNLPAWELRSSARGGFFPEDGSVSGGFRVVCGAAGS